jgi:hypothetical protein
MFAAEVMRRMVKIRKKKKKEENKRPKFQPKVETF